MRRFGQVEQDRLKHPASSPSASQPAQKGLPNPIPELLASPHKGPKHLNGGGLPWHWNLGLETSRNVHRITAEQDRDQDSPHLKIGPIPCDAKVQNSPSQSGVIMCLREWGWAACLRAHTPVCRACRACRAFSWHPLHTQLSLPLIIKDP